MKHCQNCGAEIPDEARFCTQCGALVPQQSADQTPPFVYPLPQKRYNSMCLAGFITSLGGIFILPPIAGILAVIFSVIGYRKQSQTGQMGKGMAIAGMAFGVFDFIFGIFIVYLYLYYMRYYGVIPM